MPRFLIGIESSAEPHELRKVSVNASSREEALEKAEQTQTFQDEVAGRFFTIPRTFILGRFEKKERQ